MTKRDFFRTVVKLFGLYSAVTAIFYIVPSNLSFILTSEYDFAMVLYYLFTIIVSVFLFVFLIFKADEVVSLLKLDKGFDDDQILFGELSIKKLISFSCILIGGFLIVDYLIPFLNTAINAFANTVSSLPPEFAGSEVSNHFYFNWFKSGISVLLGYLLIRNASWIGDKLS